MLDLSMNELQILPPEIGNLTNLKYINLGYNYLCGLPPEIGNLTNLENLKINNNNLYSLPPEICNLKKIKTLVVSGGNTFITFQDEVKLFIIGIDDYYGPKIDTKNIVQSLLKENQEQKEKIKELEAQVLYQPGGQGYLEAKEHFERAVARDTTDGGLMESLTRLNPTERSKNTKVFNSLNDSNSNLT